MVNKKKVVLFVIIIVLIVVALFVGFMLFSGGFGFKSSDLDRVVIKNPMIEIIGINTDESGNIDNESVIRDGIINFNENYIAYILLSMGTWKLHSSIIYGKPSLEFVLDEEVWGAEIDEGLRVRRGPVDDSDLKISMTKREAVLALLSSDIKQFMKDSVTKGNTGIEMTAGKLELFSKGYLDMYKELTGEEIKVK